MSEEKLVPKLRFSGFDDEWIIKKLNDVSDVNPKTRELPEKFVYIDLDSVNHGILTKFNQITKNEAPSRAQRCLNVNDILFQTVRPYQMNNLFFELYDGEYVASTGYAQIKSKIVPKFLYYYLHYNKFVNEVLNRCTGTSYPAINSNDLKKIKIKIPSSSNEQRLIGDLFYKLDQKIELLKDKYNYYQDFKKFLMQQIFTQKLRFDFKDTWDKVLLKDVAFIPKKTKLTNVEGLKLLTVKLHTKGIEINDRIKPNLTKRGRPYYIRRSGELLIGRQNFHNGGMGIVPKSLDGGICSNAISSFNVFEDKIDVNYLYYFLARPEYYIKSERLIGGTGQKEFSEKELLKLKIDLPSLEEQNKIVDFLLNIDHKIELSENQLNKTQEFKKGLLQQMFV